MPANTEKDNTVLTVEAVTAQIQHRRPRESARSEIEVAYVPLRTCYETATRLVGPRESVLDYAAVLFAEAAARKGPKPSPSLAVDEVHFNEDGETMSVLLSQGLYAKE